MPPLEPAYEPLLGIWFGADLDNAETVAERSRIWFGGDPAFDRTLEAQFGDWPERAVAGEFDAWLQDDRASLALLIVLDQLPRNFYRSTPRAFGYDERAQQVAAGAVARGVDERLHPLEAVFVYLPFEHAEDLALQRQSVALFETLRVRAPAQLAEQFGQFCDYAVRHLAVIEQFGRFPHRNSVLGRPTRSAERAYLNGGGEQF